LPSDVEVSDFSASRQITPCVSCPLRVRSAFQDKDREEIAFIQALRVGQKRFTAGSDIISAGHTNPELYTLFSGWSFRHQTLSDGRRQILNFFLPGDLMGFQASLMSAAQHSIEALTDVEVCVFNRSRAWTIFQERPELAFQLAWLGAREEKLVDDNLTSVGQRSARERMAAFIIGLYRRAEHLDLVENQAFTFPIRRAHLADALGLSLVHTIKTWSVLRKAGLFSYSDGRLTVINPRLTERLANFYDRDWEPRPLL
jgi:CRP-like cAMP-binding protein